ncbi:MAG: DUF4349 domain-containing protein [Treponemataceae bacterium]|nr:DUF4349 domain-containing protein [Treponemataceae bacterium]
MRKSKGYESWLYTAVCAFAAVIFCAALFSGCSKKAGRAYSAEESMVMMEAEAPMMMGSQVAASSSMKKAKVAAKSEIMTDSAVVEEAVQAGGEAVQTERKLIYTGNITVQVEDLAAAEKNVSGWVEKFGGYITNSSVSGRYLNVTARIPQKKFNEAFEEGSSIGSLQNRSVSAQDVTDQFYDLYARLETRKILRERLQSYLKAAPKIEDMLSIERELNDVQSEIESMEGQFRRLSNQIDFATIYFSASLPPNTTEQGFIYPNIGKKFSTFWADALEFLASFLVGIFYVIVFAVPLVLAAAFLYFVCFGRLGLVKKLFALAGKKTNKTKNTEENK